MNRQVPSLGKILIMVGFALSCFGLLLFLWLAFGGATPLKPKGYRFDVSFGEATQLAHEADVRISGVPVGKVKAIVANQQTGRSDATIELKPEYAPLPADARAILRQKTLLGETYVELTPGQPERPQGARQRAPGDRRRSPTPSSSTRSCGRLTPRRARPSRTGSRPRPRRSTAAARTSTPRSATSRRSRATRPSCLEILNSQKAGVRQLVRNTGEVFDALSERDGQLASLITNSNRVFATTAARDAGAAGRRSRRCRPSRRSPRRRSSGCRSSRPTRTRSSPSCGPRPSS